MKKHLPLVLATCAASLVLMACNDSSVTPNKPGTTPGKPGTTPAITAPEDKTCAEEIIAGSKQGVMAVPATASDLHKKTFCKYTEIIAENGKAIGFYAQDKIDNTQLIRARKILEFFLEDVPGSTQGANKSAIANAMADNGADMLLMNGSDDGLNDVPDDIPGQPLYDTELIVEGSKAYIDNDYENHRDAAFEEILHLMHGYGIGNLDPEAGPGANEVYSLAIDAARENAMVNGLWPTASAKAETKDWIEELRLEGSLSHEYLASVIDSYYGYWGAYDENVGMWGIYAAKTRADVAILDPQGFAVVEQFFNPNVTYNTIIASEFDGQFSLMFDIDSPYTFKSQYLLDAELSGSNNSSLIGNAQDNRLAGNAGSNSIDGMAGTDTAVFQGNASEYAIDITGDEILVQDSISDRDGIVTLKNIEILEFNDQFQYFENGVLIKQ